jgi:hypothetical protein
MLAAAAMRASTGTKDPKAADTLYIKALAAPFTVNTTPEATLKVWLITAKSVRSWRRTAAIAKRFWTVHPGRRERGQPGRPPPVRGRKIVCEILERIDGRDCVQERRPQVIRRIRQLNQRKHRLPQ